MASLTVVNILQPGHTITWKLSNGTTVTLPITAKEYVDLGRAAPIYPAPPDARLWVFEQAAGGTVVTNLPSGKLDPGTMGVSTYHAQILIRTATGRHLSVPTTIFSIHADAKGLTITPDPVAFTLRDGEFLEAP